MIDGGTSRRGGAVQHGQSVGIELTHHTGFTVSSLDASIDFWTRVMNFELILRDTIDSAFISAVIDVPGTSVTLAMVQAPGHVIELLEYSGPTCRDAFRLRPCDVGAVHVAFTVDDVHGLCARIAREGWSMLSAPKHIFRGPKEGVLVAYVRDPDGTTIELIESQGPV